MRVKVIGLGAAGNKAAVLAVNNQVIRVEDVLLINSTLKDIPKEYNGAAVQFDGAYGGCGKERKMSYDLCMKSLQSDNIGLEAFLDCDTEDQAELVILVTSTEGGTGSGSTPLVAKYIKSVLGIHVAVFGFDGFGEDARSLKNTIEFYKELEESYTVLSLSNEKFLAQCNGNRIKAEVEANKEFSRKIAILMGSPLVDSDHNIDPTDLLKISTFPGFTNIETFIVKEKIKNREQFRKILIDMIDNSKSRDLDSPSQRKLAVMININKESEDYIDYLDILYERYGTCFEKFEHIQNDPTQDEFIAFISAGSKIPVKEIENIYEKYNSMISQVNKESDDFFTVMKEKQFQDDDSMFDIGTQNPKKPTMNKNSFFGGVQKEEHDKAKSKMDQLKTRNIIDEY